MGSSPTLVRFLFLHFAPQNEERPRLELLVRPSFLDGGVNQIINSIVILEPWLIMIRSGSGGWHRKVLYKSIVKREILKKKKRYTNKGSDAARCSLIFDFRANTNTDSIFRGCTERYFHIIPASLLSTPSLISIRHY